MSAQAKPVQGEVMPPASLTPIAAFNPTAAAIATLRERYEKVVFAVATREGMAAAIKGRAELRTYRVDLEKARKKEKEESLAYGRKVDAEAKRITDEISAIEDPIDDQIKAEESRKENERLAKEKAEADRIAWIQDAIAAIGQNATEAVGKSPQEIQKVLAHVRELPVDADHFGEYQGTASAAKIRAIATLEQLHAGAIAMEEAAERARLAKIDEDKRMERERAELDRRRAEQDQRDRDEQARIVAENKRLADERARLAAAEQASRDRIAAQDQEAREKREEEQRVARAAEARQRQDREAEDARLKQEREALEADKRELERQANDLLDAKAMLTTFKDRFGKLKEFAGIVRAIDKYLEAEQL